MEAKQGSEHWIILGFLATLCLLKRVEAYKCEDSYPPGYSTGTLVPTGNVTAIDRETFKFALNVEFLEAELFLYAVFGKGLDEFSPQLTGGGPSPLGAQKAMLDEETRKVLEEFGYEEIGHIRIIKETIKDNMPRPLLDLRVQTWAKFMDEAMGSKLDPPFNPYEEPIKFMIAVYWIPYMGLTAYVGSNSNFTTPDARRLLPGLLGVEAGQDAVVRQWLYERRNLTVFPYDFTVEEATASISNLRNCLGRTGVVDEGVVVPKELGAEGKSTTNILSADVNSLSYSRTPAETLRVLYMTGNESVPGGFYPDGANGNIARGFLHFPPP